MPLAIADTFLNLDFFLSFLTSTNVVIPWTKITVVAHLRSYVGAPFFTQKIAHPAVRILQ